LAVFLSILYRADRSDKVWLPEHIAAMQRVASPEFWAQVARNPGTVISYRSVEIEVKTTSHSSYYCYPQDATCQTDNRAVPLALERDKSFTQTLDRDTVRGFRWE
jgi:hypothetical protein